MLVLGAEAVGEIAYLPLFVFLVIQVVRVRLRRRREAKALLGGARSTGSR